MVHTTRDGKVYTEVGEVDVDLGTVAKSEDGGWSASCALDEFIALNERKNGAIDLLEDHFIKTHTTPNI